MVQITSDLLRKRAEHNEGCLSNLKEITLHQYEIEKIELVGELCRELQILYLQNNMITKLGTWCDHHAKQLCSTNFTQAHF